MAGEILASGEIIYKITPSICMYSITLKTVWSSPESEVIPNNDIHDYVSA